MCDRHVHADCRAGARAAREENIGSFQGLETGWLARQFLGNRLATSEGAVSNTQLLTVYTWTWTWGMGISDPNDPSEGEADLVSIWAEI